MTEAKTPRKQPELKASKPIKAKGQPRTPKGNAESIAKQAKAERDRKAASKKALHDELTKRKPDAESGRQAEAKPPKNPEVSAEAVQAAEAKRVTEHAAYLVALRVDAAAVLGPDATEEALQGYVDSQLTPDAGAAEKTLGYAGPMLALRAAEKHYVVALNGNPCNGDDLATICGKFSRETVVKGLIAALGYDSNPYISLNPGQQSMNLRNKARHALKVGLITTADIAAALAAVV